MIDTAYVQRMARYNRWQNQNLYGVADQLSDDERRRERGAFFGSVHKTLSHLLWADQIWMSRFTDRAEAEGQHSRVRLAVSGLERLKRDRAAFDEAMIAWADKLEPAALEGDLSWFSGALKRDLTKPKWLLVTHMFNHGTHHRGQVHCMLTQAGGKPHATDLQALPE